MTDRTARPDGAGAPSPRSPPDPFGAASVVVPSSSSSNVVPPSTTAPATPPPPQPPAATIPAGGGPPITASAAVAKSPDGGLSNSGGSGGRPLTEVQSSRRNVGGVERSAPISETASSASTSFFVKSPDGPREVQYSHANASNASELHTCGDGTPVFVFSVGQLVTTGPVQTRAGTKPSLFTIKQDRVVGTDHVATAPLTDGDKRRRNAERAEGVDEKTVGRAGGVDVRLWVGGGTDDVVDLSSNMF